MTYDKCEHPRCRQEADVFFINKWLCNVHLKEAWK